MPQVIVLIIVFVVFIVLPLWKIYQHTEASVSARIISACLVPMLSWISYYGLQGYTEFLKNSK